MPPADRIADPWGPRTPYARGERWPVRVDRHGATDDEAERWAPSASLLHSNGDAMDIAVRDGAIAGVRGRAHDRVNHGRLDPKDLYGWQANNSPDRLTRPLVRAGGELVESDWDTAMERIVAALARPAGAARRVGADRLLHERPALPRGLLRARGHRQGRHRHAAHGRQHPSCTATAATALKASFGTDGQPGSYADVDHCDAIALYGHNVAETQPVLWMRMLDRRRGADPPAMLCVDPRLTPVAREADVHLPVRSGTNVALMNALQRELIAHGWIDEA